jgi:hypothetical protein
MMTSIFDPNLSTLVLIDLWTLVLIDWWTLVLSGFWNYVDNRAVRNSRTIPHALEILLIVHRQIVPLPNIKGWRTCYCHWRWWICPKTAYFHTTANFDKGKLCLSIILYVTVPCNTFCTSVSKWAEKEAWSFQSPNYRRC